MHKFKIIFGILIYLSIGGFAFAQNQFSNFTILENAVDIHAGVHAALNPADDSLEFTAYSAATNHGLVHVTIDDGNAVVTEIEANVFAGLVPATGLDTYFVFGSDGKRYVAYYHQVAGVFKVATDASGSWVTHVIDNTGTTGLSPILSVSSPGNIFSAYYRSDSGDLVSSSGTLGGIYTRTVLANVGNVDPEVSFVGNPQVGSRELLFRNENLTTVRHAIFSSNTWTQSSLGIDGYNPSGSYNDNGDFYVNAAAENYSGLGASDTGFLYYYKASGGAPNSGINFDKGHAPDFSQTSYASAYANEFRSALFPDSTTIRLSYVTSEGSYSQTLNPVNNCMVDLRNVQVLVDSSDGIYVVSSLGFDSCEGGINSIGYSYREADPDSGGGDDPGDDPGDSPPNDDPPNDDNPGDDPDDGSLDYNSNTSKTSIEFTLAANPGNSSSCLISARGYKKASKIIASKDLATIDSSQSINIIAKLKILKAKFNLDFTFTCEPSNQSKIAPNSVITTEAIVIKTKGKKKAKGKKINKVIKKFISNLNIQN
ncbi:MAG: hypothetical protein KDD56_02405 [Bdellovibrionales bacterium]|nr:hypothetical protein [Bdellovibrionales bacterium]